MYLSEVGSGLIQLSFVPMKFKAEYAASVSYEVLNCSVTVSNGCTQQPAAASVLP